MKISKVIRNSQIPLSFLVWASIAVLVVGPADLLFIPAILGATLEIIAILITFKLFIPRNTEKTMLMLLTYIVAFEMFAFIPYINAAWFNWLMSGVLILTMADMLVIPMKTKILEFVDSIEIDVEELDSFTYDRNPYGLEYPLSMGSGEADWDEDEEMCAKFDRAISDVEDEGIGEYINVEDGLNEFGELTEEAVEFLKEERKKYE